MSKPNRTTIDDAILKRFADGRLNSAAEVKVAVAIENSPELQARMAAISSDEFLERVKQIAVTSRLSKAGSKSRFTKVAENDPVSPSSIAGIPQELVDSKDYQVLKELGRGGMGVVYMAKYLPMDRMEVLKVLNEQLVQKEAAKQRFISEMKAIGKLNHPFIATAYQRVVLPTQLVFSMEYVPGIDLHKFIQKYQPVSIPVACALASQIATALQHAHSRKTVHRDIKPSNVMVFKEDGKLQIKILDFGLAKATSEQPVEGLTAEGTMLGTPEYMAPEQALDAATADIRADIYSLGCTLYHLLTGKPPFSGTYQSVLMAHAQKEAAYISFSRLDVPVELSEFVAKMMAKEPAKRFQTPKAVSDALKPFVGTGKLKPASDNSSAKTDTLLNLASPSRDTSVETPAISLQLAEEVPHDVPIDVSVGLANLETLPRRQPNPKQRSKSQGTRRSPPQKVLTAIGRLFLVLLLFSGTLIFRTEHGTLVLENLPPDATVMIDGEQVTISDLNGNGPTEIRIAPGKRQVEVKTNGVVVLVETVSIAAGERVPVQISLSAKDISKPKLAKTSALGQVTTEKIRITAMLPVGYEIGPIRAGEQLSLRYLSGKWKGWGHGATESPDTLTPEKRESCRVALGRLDSNGLYQRISIVPRGTATAPFRWTADKDYERLILRINDNDFNFANNVDGDVTYELTRTQPNPSERRLQTDVPSIADVREVVESDSKSKLNLVVRGSNLAGWLGDRRFWSEDNGVIVGRSTPTSRPSTNTYLVWSGHPSSNFELDFDCLAVGGNSGVLYRGTRDPNSPFCPTGIQLDIDALTQEFGTAYETNGRGLISQAGEYGIIGPSAAIVRKPLTNDANKGEPVSPSNWNHYRIRSVDGKLSHYINDRLVCQVDDSKNRVPGDGLVALELHRGPPMEVRFKNLILTQIPQSNPPFSTSDDQIKLPAAQLSFPFVIKTGNWTSHSGIIEQRDLGERGSVLVFGDSAWRNYDFKFSAKRLSGSHGFKAVFHWHDTKNFMMFGLGNYYNRGHDISYEVNGAWARNPHGHYVKLKSDNKIAFDRWYRVEVRVRESQYECYLDNVLICRGVNNRFSSGRVGLATWDSNAQFRDIVVSSPEGDVWLSGVPQLEAGAALSLTPAVRTAEFTPSAQNPTMQWGADPGSETILPNDDLWGDLLRPVELDTLAAYENWKRDGSSVVPNDFDKIDGVIYRYATKCPPVSLGDRYQGEVEMKHKSTDRFATGVVVGGNPCLIDHDDGENNDLSWLSTTEEGQLRFYGEVLAPRKSIRAVVTVAQNRNSVTLPTGQILEWENDATRLSSMHTNDNFWLSLSDSRANRIRSFH